MQRVCNENAVSVLVVGVVARVCVREKLRNSPRSLTWIMEALLQWALIIRLPCIASDGASSVASLLPMTKGR